MPQARVACPLSALRARKEFISQLTHCDDFEVDAVLPADVDGAPRAIRKHTKARAGREPIGLMNTGTPSSLPLGCRNRINNGCGIGASFPAVSTWIAGLSQAGLSPNDVPVSRKRSK